VPGSSARKADPHSTKKAEFFATHQVVRQFERDVSSS
jgi:hypothetical protein